MKKLVRNTFIGLFAFVAIGWLFLQMAYGLLMLDTPEVEHVDISSESINEVDGVRAFKGNFYRQNESGLWEAYLEGKPYERGRVFGLLAQNEVIFQEESFIGQIRKLVPSEWFLNTLKYGVVWFNRNLDHHVTEEYQREIFGVSRAFSDDYDFVGDKYSRMLNYHAAHDIGHALQDLSIVGCTSFAVWNQYSADSSLLIGRNFDFYMGDDFAKEKLILFMRPDSGYAFASITWAGFMGVVSGMNEHGLTVTLNAAKSAIPNGAKTPISLLAREILQYARNIEEAYAIARSRQTFVSESILIGSAADRSSAIIEKSPDRIDLFRPNDSRLTCANHYQSEAFLTDPVNLQNIKDSDSYYRFKRMNELLENHFPIDVAKSADVLRNQKGLNDEELGMGNPKAINQLLAHHAVVFQPEKRLIWVSTNPFQLGKFLCYDLDRVFQNDSIALTETMFIDSLSIPEDRFVESDAYQRFLQFKELKNRLFSHFALGKEIEWNAQLEEEFINSNPNSYVTYQVLGDYYFSLNEKAKAQTFYALSLDKEVASEQERNKIEKSLEECR